MENQIQSRATLPQQRLVRAWEEDSERVFYDSDGEPMKVLRFVAICQSTEGGLYVYGLDNNVQTIEIELDDLHLDSPNT